MIVIDLDALVQARGGNKVTTYLMERGFTYGTARRVSNGATLVQLKDSTVFQLCEALGCRPNHLFCWRGPKTDALEALNSMRPTPLYELLQGLSLEQKVEFWDKMKAWSDAHPSGPKVMGGKLRLDIRRLVGLRTTGSARKVLEGMGLTEMEAKGVLSKGHSALRLTVMTKLCKGFGCLPDDLYSFEGPDGHVLSGLERAPMVNLEMIPVEVLLGMRDGDLG